MKFQPPFACWAARMAASAAGGGVPHTSFFASDAVERVAERGSERGGVGAAAGVEQSDEVTGVPSPAGSNADGSRPSGAALSTMVFAAAPGAW